MRPCGILPVLATAAGLATAARAQETAPAALDLADVFGDAARERLADPALFERVGEIHPGGRFARLLEDLRLQFKAFQASSEGDLALGFSFDFAKSRPASVESGAPTIDLVARGNVAFDRPENPDDFLSTALRLRWFGTHTLGSSRASRADLAEELPNPGVADLAGLDRDRFAALSARHANESSARRIRADPDFQALAGAHFESIERELPPELIWDTELHAGLESNQDFSSRQVVLGASFGSRLVSWDPEARLSRWNAFDLPAAALRWLAGEDQAFHPSGLAYPTLAAGLDVVDASRDETRGALTDDENFLRARIELGLKSQVFTLDEELLFFTAGWRSDNEIDAPAAVRRAETDRSSYLQLGLDLPHGWVLTYSTGRLPLDEDEDSTFALGFYLRL